MGKEFFVFVGVGQLRALTFSFLFALLLAVVLASGCVQQSLPALVACPTCARFEQIAKQVKDSFPTENCVFLSQELNKRLLSAGYNSRVVSGLLWDFNCVENPSLPLACLSGAHEWVEVKVLIEATNALVVPPNLEKFYQGDV